MFKPLFPSPGDYGSTADVQRRERARGSEYDAAAQRAWIASHWVWGRPVNTQADALVAARWVFLEAYKETNSNDNYATLARKVAYYMEKNSVGEILSWVYEQTRAGAPMAAAKARTLLGNRYVPPTSFLDKIAGWFSL